MSEVPADLGEGILSGGSDEVLYTVPITKSARVVSLTLANVDSVNHTCSIYLKRTSTASEKRLISPKDMICRPNKLVDIISRDKTMEEGDVILADTGVVGDKIEWTISGYESS